MTHKACVSFACVWIMLTVSIFFANDGYAKDPSGDHSTGIHCPKCGDVPEAECKVEKCDACKKHPGKIVHKANCESLRHKCGRPISRKPVKTEIKEKAAAIPDDLAISYETKTAGVLPIVTSFMRINRTKEGAFFFVQGQRAWDGEKQKETVGFTYELTNEQCLKVFKSIQELGFFKLKDDYSVDDLDGGEVKLISMTANGKSKKVSTYGMNQVSFDKLAAIIEDLSLINQLKSKK